MKHKLDRLFAFAILFSLCTHISCHKRSNKRQHASSLLSTHKNRISQQTISKNKKKNVVLFLGDSLTAGYQLAQQEAYPSLIDEYWKKHKNTFRAKNAGVSGDTTAGVLRRIGWVLTPDIHTVFLAIGGNDGLRGLPLQQTLKNLREIVKQILKRGRKVILAQMQIPPNYGPEYAKTFSENYQKIAKEFRIPRMPFMLQNVAGKKEYNLEDGIHPNAAGQKLVAKEILDYFKQKGLFQPL